MRRAVPIADVAELLAVAEITVRRLIATGELRAQRVGRSVRVFVDSVEAYQRQSEIVPEHKPAAAKHRASRSHVDAMARLASLGIR